MECGEKETNDRYIDKLQREREKVREHVSKRDDVARKDVDTDVEAAKVALPSISAGSSSKQTS